MQLKEIKDYYESLCEKFPDVSEKDIKKKFWTNGWKSLYLHNLYGGDTLITDDSLWCYIGTLRRDSIKTFLNTTSRN